MTYQRSVIAAVVALLVVCFGCDKRDDSSVSGEERENGSGGAAADPSPKAPPRTYSPDSLKRARGTAMWNKYPCIDYAWLDGLIRQTSTRRSIPETELWYIACHAIKDVSMVSDDRKAAELESILSRTISEDSSIRARHVFRIFSPNLYYEQADGQEAIHFPLLNCTGRPISRVRGTLVISDVHGNELCRLSIRWEQQMGPLDGARPDCYTHQRVPGSVDKIIRGFQALGKLRAVFVTDAILYQDGEVERFVP